MAVLRTFSSLFWLSSVVAPTSSTENNPHPFASPEQPPHLRLNHSGIVRAPLLLESTGNSGLTRLAFGSCNHHIRRPWAWGEVAKRHPDVWIWLGDIVYADKAVAPKWRVPASSERLAAHFQGQLDVPEYRDFLRKVPVIGVNDDHDIGKNDADKTYNATV